MDRNEGIRFSRTATRAGRHASWLELFFDLAFAVAVSRLPVRLSDSTPSVDEVLALLGLFVVVWWSWVGQAFYDNRFERDDAPHRLIVLIGTGGVLGMAAGVDQAPRTLLLPAGFLVVRAGLLVLYLRARCSDPATRRVTDIYLVGFGTGWLIWFVSLFIPGPFRPLAWAVGMLVDLATPWVRRRRLSQSPVDTSHLPERLGQFTVVLLGTVLAQLISAVPANPRLTVLTTAAAAFCVPAAIWWIYTIFAEVEVEEQRLRGGQEYSYIHAIVVASLLLVGWGLRTAVGHEVDRSPQLPVELRLVLGGSIIAWMISGTVLLRIAVGRINKTRIAMTGAGLVAVAISLATVTAPLAGMGLLAAVLIAYVVLGRRHLARMAARADQSSG